MAFLDLLNRQLIRPQKLPTIQPTIKLAQRTRHVLEYSVMIKCRNVIISCDPVIRIHNGSLHLQGNIDLLLVCPEG